VKPQRTMSLLTAAFDPDLHCLICVNSPINPRCARHQVLEEQTPN
jgi:hypothetical protein